MNELAKALFVETKSRHEVIYKQVKKLREEVESCNDTKAIANIAYALRESSKYLDDALKEMHLLYELCEKIACVLWLKDADGEPIRTKHCTATPDVTMIASIPKKRTQPEEYAAMMRFLQIPEHLWNTEHEDEVVRPHWPGLVGLLSDMIANGQPLPPGIDPSKTYPKYKLKIWRRKSVDE